MRTRILLDNEKDYRMATDNKTIYMRILNEYFSGGNEAVLDEFYADNHVNHSVGVNGAQAWKQYMIPFQAAFPICTSPYTFRWSRATRC